MERHDMVLWVFDGDMVGKWTNDPCNGVDEVVNHFWVLTGTMNMKELNSKFLSLLRYVPYIVDIKPKV